MKATCLIVANPLFPAGSLTERAIHRPQRIRTLAPRQGAVVAILNGRPILRAGWRRRLRHGDVILFARLPAGGGGAAGGSNPLRTLMMIALMAFATPLGLGLANAFGGTLFGLDAALSAKLGSLAIVLAGSAAINALAPVHAAKPLPAASPTYSIGAQGNAARIGAVIPVQYGRILTWPDLAALPYTEFQSDDQYVYQLLCLGVGSFDIEEIRVQDTPITAFSEIETEIIEPGDPVTLFPTAVVTSEEVSGQELMGRTTATWTASGSVVTFTATAHGRASGDVIRTVPSSGTGPTDLFEITGVPDADTFTIASPDFGASGTALIQSVLGGMDGFVAAAPDTRAHHLGVDLIYPLGLYHNPGSGALANKTASVVVQARKVDDDGAPLAAWVTLATIAVTDRTTTPIRRSYRYAVTPGRYRVRAWRVEEKSDSSSDGHQVLLGGLRSYMAEPTSYPPVTLIALRMKATNNLSIQASRQIAVLSTRKLPVWQGPSLGWTAPIATRSIAWAIADAARNSVYGPGLGDAEIDLAALKDLDDLWQSRSDLFDGRFEQSGTWWDGVQSIARCGRAQCNLQAGILRTVRDGPASVPVAMYSERNMTPDSFVVNYLMPTPDTADAIKVAFFDAATWSQRTVACKMPGSTAAKPSKVQFFGITSTAHAQREGMFLAAVNQRRRRIVKFTTEMEGRLPSFGDLIAIQHSALGWGQQSEVLAWETGPRLLTLSEPMTWTVGAVHYLSLRRRNGSVWGPVVATKGATPYQVILASVPDFDLVTGGEMVRTHATFGPNTASALAKVASVTPKSNIEYDIQAVIEDPAVHTAETGVIPPAVKYSSLPRAVTKPVIKGPILARMLPGSATKALFSWPSAPNADTYQLDMAEGDDPTDPDVSWTRVIDTTGTSYAADLIYATRTMIRLRASGLAAGPWLYALLGDLIPDFWLSDETPFWADDDAAPFWSN